ncbi:AGE family epimerase/isomerase [Bacillus sp. JCM 19041]|uniref:AGE family epimerase/isomerase n=1 Tax=Bacillus sp. JCM 19041 TaxID=1460637 RepID=UPI0006CF2BCD
MFDSNFYKKQIEDTIWPFWQKAYDKNVGGVFTCFTNDGSELLSTDKYIWSQGRFLWITTKMYELALKGKVDIRADLLQSMSKDTLNFLQMYAFTEEGEALYAVTETGELLPEQETISIYADCFCLLGMSSYARIFNDQSVYCFCMKLMTSIENRLKEGVFETEPYPIKDGYLSHSINMILINVINEMIKTAKKINEKDVEDLRTCGDSYVTTILTQLVIGNTRIAEFVSEEKEFHSSMLYRHVNPGHTLESIWFLVEYLEESESGCKDAILEQLVTITKKTLTVGWDQEFGGLFRFVDCEGGKPEGVSGEGRYEVLINSTWDMKLWWPHSEALYALTALFQRSGDQSLLKWLEKIQEYTFKVFPNPNKKTGEWIQIRNREGCPVEKVVALPVKDPFHIWRSMILLIESRGD